VPPAQKDGYETGFFTQCYYYYKFSNTRQNDTLQNVGYKEIQHRKNSHSKNFLSFSFIFHIPRGKEWSTRRGKKLSCKERRKGKKRDFIFSIFVWRGGNLICWVACFSERDRNGKIAKYLSFYNQIKENENLIVKRIHKKNVEEFLSCGRSSSTEHWQDVAWHSFLDFLLYYFIIWFKVI